MAKSRRENTARTQPKGEGVNPRSERVTRLGQAARMRPVAEREEVNNQKIIISTDMESPTPRSRMYPVTDRGEGQSSKEADSDK